MTQGKEVVAIGDGAHWIWNLVEEHFPGAIQKSICLESGLAAWGEGSPQTWEWAEKRLDKLWEGKVTEAIRHS